MKKKPWSESTGTWYPMSWKRQVKREGYIREEIAFSHWMMSPRESASLLREDTLSRAHHESGQDYSHDFRYYLSLHILDPAEYSKRRTSKEGTRKLQTKYLSWLLFTFPFPFSITFISLISVLVLQYNSTLTDSFNSHIPLLTVSQSKTFFQFLTRLTRLGLYSWLHLTDIATTFWRKIIIQGY